MACHDSRQAWVDWERAGDESRAQHERFVVALKTCNPPDVVRAYEDDCDEWGLTALWIPLLRWQVYGDTEWTGEHGRLVLPPRKG